MSFSLKQENSSQYPSTKIHPNWADWRRNWYFVQAGSTSPHLLVPTAPAESLANSKDPNAQDEALLPIVKKFEKLRNSQVTGAMIVGDFMRRRIAPLQRRPRSLWETRQETGSHTSPGILKGKMHFLLSGERYDLSVGDFSLLDRIERGDAVPLMPRCNAYGLQGTEFLDPLPVPRATVRGRSWT